MQRDGAALWDCASARAKGLCAGQRRSRSASSRHCSSSAGKDPLKAYADTLTYVFGNAYGFSELLVRMVPLMLTAVAAALPARIGLINVGAEGQLYMGAWLATAGALAFSNQPAFVLLPLLTVLGFIGGGLWALIAGRVAGIAARQRDDLDAAAQLCRAADRELFHFRAVAQPGKRVLSAVSGLCRSRAAADFFSFAGASRSRLRAGSPHSLLAGHDADPLRSRDAGDRRQSGSGAAAGHSDHRAYILIVMFVAGGVAGLAGMAEVTAIQGRLVSELSPGYGFIGFLVVMACRHQRESAS